MEKKSAKGSAIAEHVIKSGHEIAWDRAEVIDYEQKWGAKENQRVVAHARSSALTAS